MTQPVTSSSLFRRPLFRGTMLKLSGTTGYGQLSTSLKEILSPSTSVMSRLANKCPLMTMILSCWDRESPFSFRSKPVCPLHLTHPMYHPPMHSSLRKKINHQLSLNNHFRTIHLFLNNHFRTIHMSPNNRSRTSHLFLNNRSRTIHHLKSNLLIKITHQRI